MSVRRNHRGKWIVDIVFTHADGRVERVEDTSPVQSRRGAETYERQVRQALLAGTRKRKEVPTFEEWHDGRYWREWVVANKNKPSTQEAKESIYKNHLKNAFGQLRLDEIGAAQIAQFRATLVEAKLSDKSINNILTTLSKPLKYAVDVEVIDRAPKKIGILKVERPEIEWWELEEYPRILHGAREEGCRWYVAVCLAGEAGLRVGELRALIWERDVDLIAGTLTVNEQTRKGVTGTPKGRTRRTVPMTASLLAALRGLSVVRRGLVLRNEDGSALTDGQTTHVIYRICRRAGLPERAWHVLRHAFGTHAALLGVNPWRLMAWLGHKRIDETMRYVHIAETHQRPLPELLVEAGRGAADPDQRVLQMLSARANLTRTPQGSLQETAGASTG